MRKPDSDRCRVCGSKRVVETRPTDEFDNGPIWFCLHCRNSLGVGNYYDNASVIVRAVDKLKAGLGAEAAYMLSMLSGHIRENPDPKSEKWLLPQIDELIEAAAKGNTGAGEAATQKLGSRKIRTREGPTAITARVRHRRPPEQREARTRFCASSQTVKARRGYGDRVAIRSSARRLKSNAVA